MEETVFLPGYCAAIKDPSSQKRYKEKLQAIDNIDPYELKMSEWRDAVSYGLQSHMSIFACI